MRGLIGRRGLPAGEGMLLRPEAAIHTAFMRFPIDALFLDRNLRVLGIVEQLPPWRIASKARARAVLELPAGECARRRVEIGDRLELRDRAPARDMPAGPPQFSDGDAIRPGDRDLTIWRGGEPARLQPLSILITTHDRRFRTVMSLLLARRNCSVITTANASRVTELVARETPDVVVIDISEPAAAATVAMLEALERSIGVVLVADEVGSHVGDPPLVAKWGPFESMLGAIERAYEHRGSNGESNGRR
jgi:uncharacterized membrane protein (UPF0127 family)